MSNGGEELLEKFRTHGLTIQTGFLDNNHPRKEENYFSSWQERFLTEDPQQALHKAVQQHNEYDECWWKEDDGFKTLMTKITLSAFAKIGDDRYLRFPRIALGEPTLQNGYRAYPLGNGKELSLLEKQLLFAAYDCTKEGINWRTGDLIIFDNIRYGHSRESFEGKREVFVGMSGMVWDDRSGHPPIENVKPTISSFQPKKEQFYRYRQPISETKNQNYSMRIFDARGKLNTQKISSILEEFVSHGALHIINTGLQCKHPGEFPIGIRDLLGFEENSQFPWGGVHSGRTSRRELGNGVFSTDYYPSHLFLLPHNEILYQRHMPTRLLFFSTQSSVIGGRTFVHSSKVLERFLLSTGQNGKNLLKKMHRYGFRIDSGFLDRYDPRKENNHFRSWQDRFQTENREEAYERCIAARDQFDNCWWKKDFPAGEQYPVLMTRIQIPAVIQHVQDQQEYLLFPRIALDGPTLCNGFRRFSFGNGEEMSSDEIDILISAYLYSAQGRKMQSNDILLIDNIRYGHSREIFEGERDIGVIMAGSIWNKGSLHV